MARCKNCLLYGPENDQMIRESMDVIVDGEEPKDEHFCFGFEPIPDGVFEGDIDCPLYKPRT